MVLVQSTLDLVLANEGCSELENLGVGSRNPLYLTELCTLHLDMATSVGVTEGRRRG